MGNAAADWEEHARKWITWTRAPGLDSYWRYRDDFLRLVPAPGKSTLDLGCGEGRLSRDLAENGHQVTGIDASATLIDSAREAHPDGEYLLADAADLPFEDESFDVVIAYNALMDIDDMAGAVREAARVLTPDGRFVISVVHPANTGAKTEDGAFVVSDTYFEGTYQREDVERDGIPMVFAGYTHPLTRYTDAFEASGLLIEAVREPKAVLRDGSVSPYPWHLWLRLVKG
ncbi:class I SAM-dependent methyltransferase [Amycolatopsis sp. NPDC059657]|uniref:class I SAM-dependent methyltransferase n=1 Tax=Amycolatopsis sp. NPDC059657 TaxID=3346899 RepID=UPI00366DD950